jgi:hypothetical protein
VLEQVRCLGVDLKRVLVVEDVGIEPLIDHTQQCITNEYMGQPCSAAAPCSGPAGPEPGEFQTTLAGGDGYQPEVLLDRDVAAAFRLKPEQAEAVVREVSAALAPWRDVAAKHGATRSEVELMAGAFESQAG